MSFWLDVVSSSNPKSTWVSASCGIESHSGTRGQAGFLPSRRGLGFLSSRFLSGEEHAGWLLITPQGPGPKGTEAEWKLALLWGYESRTPLLTQRAHVFCPQPWNWWASSWAGTQGSLCLSTVPGPLRGPPQHYSRDCTTFPHFAFLSLLGPVFHCQKYSLFLTFPSLCNAAGTSLGAELHSHVTISMP